MTTRIELFGQDDQYLCLHGPGEANRGVWLGEGPAGIFGLTPEKQTWTSGARSIGSRQKNRKILHRDMKLPLLVKDTTAHTFEENLSYVINAVGFELDPYDDDAKYARIAVTTEISGTRFVDIVQFEEPDYDPEHDDLDRQFGHELALNLRVGDADWYGETEVSAHEFTDNGSAELWVSNPCPRPMLHWWRVTEGKWLIPDFSWRGKRGARRPGGEDETRYVTVEVEEVDGVTEINPADRSVLMVENEHETNILGRQTSRGFFIHEIPPYTQPQPLTVFVENCPDSGARVELHQPRRWTAPFGGELR